jgi:hypothetical protein
MRSVSVLRFLHLADFPGSYRYVIATQVQARLPDGSSWYVDSNPTKRGKDSQLRESAFSHSGHKLVITDTDFMQ